MTPGIGLGLCLALAPQGGAAPAVPSPLVPSSAVPARELVAYEAFLVACAIDADAETCYAVTQGVDSVHASLHAFDLDRLEPLWSTRLFGPESLVAVGDDLVLTSGPGAGIPTFSYYERDDGERGGSQGGTLADQRATGIAGDPRDRWLWLGTDNGVVTRLVPGKVNQFHNRKLDNGGVTALVADPKGKTLAVGGADGTVRFVDASAARVDDDRVWRGHRGAVVALAWDDRGKLCASGDEQGRVVVRSVRSGKQRGAFAAHDGAVQCLALHPKGKWLASGAADGALRLLQIDSGEQLARLQLPKASREATTSLPRAAHGVVALRFVAGGDRLLAAGDNLLVAFDVEAIDDR